MKMRSGSPTPQPKSLGDREGFFDGGRVGMHKDFGFTGSLKKAAGGAVPPMAPDQDDMAGPMSAPPMAAAPPSAPPPMPARRPPPARAAAPASAMHPHGMHIVGSQPHPAGGVKLMHQHGGFSHARADGSMTHHTADGGMCSGGAVKMAAGGDTDAYARGGRAHLPRAMKPVAARAHSPINTAPRNPNTTTTPRNAMPGGVMPYGVEPSAEPDPAGSTQNIPQFRRGGKVRMGADRGSFD